MERIDRRSRKVGEIERKESLRKGTTEREIQRTKDREKERISA